MKPSSAKAKGRRLQQQLAKDVERAFGLAEGDVLSRSSGATGTDLILSPAATKVFPYAVEAKNQERVNVWQSWTQANANGTARLTPLLIVSRNGISVPLAILAWDDFLTLNGGIL
ncbi:MAG TPA: hypothetical protein VFI41_12575 [Gemmatimonadales bacterium]|nr:hypothetical protein [Gemmatimonadales bacterium]